MHENTFHSSLQAINYIYLKIHWMKILLLQTRFFYNHFLELLVLLPGRVLEVLIRMETGSLHVSFLVQFFYGVHNQWENTTLSLSKRTYFADH